MSALEQAKAALDDQLTYVIVHRPNMIPDRKGGFSDKKHVEDMLRELYEIYPDCICDVITMPRECYPDSGREWISIYGDKRRKPIPPYSASPVDRNAVIEECAKVCDERADMHKYGVVWSSQRGEEADNCASSIRKLKTTSDAARKESK